MKKLFFAVLLMFCLTGPGSAAAAVAADLVAVTAVGVPVDINQAGVADLQALPGVGPALAERIVAYREAQGPFQSVDQLAEVKGIGAKKLETIRANVTLK
jgi:competence protein ComEA